MGNDIKLGITLNYDGKAVTGGVAINRDDFRKLAVDATAAGKALTGSQTAAAEGVRSISSQLSRMQSIVAGAFASDQVLGYARAVLESSSAINQFNARLKVTTSSAAEFGTAQSGVLAHAQHWGIALADAGSGFARLNPALGQLGGNAETTLRMMDSLAASMRLSGATSSETAGVMLQFSQAMGSGVVQGDEFRSLMEGAQPLMREVAAVLGKTTGELKQMGSEGKLTSEVFGNAVLQASGRLKAMAEGIPPSFGAAAQAVKNSAEIVSAAFVEGLQGDAGSGNVMSHLAQSLAESKVEAAALGAAVRESVGPVLALTAAYITLKTAARLGPVIEERGRAVAAEVGYQVALRESTLAAKAQAAQEIERLTAMRLALTAQRDGAVVTLASANAAKLAADGIGAYSFALRASSDAAAQRSGALGVLAETSRSLVAVNGQLAEAENRHQEASNNASIAAKVKAGAVNLAAGALAAFGGPVGLAITAIAGLTAWFVSSRTEAEALETQLWKTNRAKDAIAAGKAPSTGDMQALNSTLKTWQDRLDVMDQKKMKSLPMGRGTSFSRAQVAEQVANLNDQITYGEKARKAMADAEAKAASTVNLSDPGALAKLSEGLKWREKLIREHTKTVKDLEKASLSALIASPDSQAGDKVIRDSAAALAAEQLKFQQEMAGLPEVAQARALSSAQSEADVARAKAAAANYVEYYKSEYEAFRLSTAGFIASTTALKAQAIDSEIAALQKRAALAKPEERIGIEGKVDALRTAREQLGTEAAGLTEKAAREAQDALDKLAVAGGKALDPLAAAGLQFGKDFGEIIQRAVADSDEAALSAARQAWANISSVTQFNSGKAQFDGIGRDLEASLANIKLGLATGRLSAVDALVGENSVRARAVSDLERVHAEVQAISASIADPAVHAALGELSKKLAEAKLGARDADVSDWTVGAENALQKYQQSALNVAASTEQAFTRGFQGMEDAAVQFAMTGKGSFASLANSAIADMIRMQARAAMAPVTAGIGGWLKGVLGFGDTATPASSSATPGSDFLGSGITLTNANGNVFSGSPSLHQYVNTVQTSPQVFGYDRLHGFAKGGVFAEAGPEAVMPLTRDGSGRLGVRAQGGSGGDITLSMPVIIDARGADSGVEQRLSGAIAQLQSWVIKTVPGVVRAAQLRNRQSPTV